MAYLDSHGLQTLWNKIKAHFGKTLEVDKSATAVDIKLKNAASTPDVLSTITLPAAGTNNQAGVMTAAQAAKLAGISEGAEANVQADWAQTVTTADDYIKNKPSLATVATSGSYTDLSNKPTIDSSLSSTSTNAVQNKVINTALGGKVDKVSGKGLSTNDYTTTEKNKLSGIAAGAEVNVQPDWDETDSTSDAYIKNKPVIPDGAVIYHNLGQNTDGAIDQKVVTNELNAKEIASNKVTSWSTTTTDTNYPSEKLVKDGLDGKMDKVNPTGTGSFSLNRKASTTIGTNSFAEGSNTTASEMNSHAEGWNTIASGGSSHAEGFGTKASGNCSHAEGGTTEASGTDAHAEGDGTKASGDGSHAEGQGTIANAASAHAQGRYNVANTSHADIVGNGRTNSTRSNAYALDWDGNGYYAGDVYVGCNADSTGGTKLATVTELDNKVDKVSGKGLSTNDYTTTEKNKLAGIEANANNYVHPTTSGNKHIPSGGSSGKILGWSADGTAAWINAPDTGVTKITAGTNVTISPTGGTGNVTINATDTTYVFNTAYNASTNKAATMSDINSAVVGHAKYCGTLAKETDLTGLTNFKQGNYWVVSTGWTSASMGLTFDVGNMLFANADGSTFAAAKFDVIQADIEAIPDSEINALS